MSDRSSTLPDPAEVALRDGIELLYDVLVGRSEGNRDTNIGNGDEDLIYAAEEARDAIALWLRSKQ